MLTRASATATAMGTANLDTALGSHGMGPGPLPLTTVVWYALL